MCKCACLYLCVPVTSETRRSRNPWSWSDKQFEPPDMHTGTDSGPLEEQDKLEGHAMTPVPNSESLKANSLDYVVTFPQKGTKINPDL